MSDRINPETGKTFKQEKLDALDEFEKMYFGPTGVKTRTDTIYKYRKDKKAKEDAAKAAEKEARRQEAERVAAFNQAIIEHEKEGGIQGRYKRYSNNCKIICDGMRDIGFKQLLPNELQAPIIITFMQPKNFNFNQFYDALSQRDFLIYPGKLTVADTFRIGCIGNLHEQDMHSTIDAIKEVLNELQFRVQ